jgi:RNA-directed DNA polymerase
MEQEHKDAAQAASAVPATAKREADTDARWAWVEAAVWTGPMLAALQSGVKGGRWYSLMDKVAAAKTLQAAWERVRANRGSHGVDGMSVQRFAEHVEQYLAELGQALREGSYRPEPVRRVEIPKATGGVRPLGIPAVKDRVVQAALKLVMEPIFEREFDEANWGFRPQRGCKDALREVDRQLREGRVWVVDADLQAYFDSIDHERLMALVERRISDGRVLSLIRQFLTQDVLHGLQRWTPNSGTPQGAVISPLLANVYLHELDVKLRQGGWRLVRYADDFVVLCDTQPQAEAALEAIGRWTVEVGLTLHPDKTKAGNCLLPGHGFDFLGYRFEAGRRHVRKKSLQALRDRLRERTRRANGNSLSRIVAELNPLLRGWFGYFKHAHASTFGPIDAFVRRRLRSILCKRQGLSYVYHRSYANHRRWPNTFFAELGLFTLREAWQAASQSR